MRNPPSIVMKNDNALIEGPRSLPLKEDKQRVRPHKLADMSSVFRKKCIELRYYSQSFHSHAQKQPAKLSADASHLDFLLMCVK